MEITEVKVYPVRDKKLRAFASIVFDGSFMVNDIKVIQGKDGLFISMPSRRQKNGRFKDIAHPLNQETRQVLEERILDEFRRVAEAAEDPAEAAAESGLQGAAEPRPPASPRRRTQPRRPASRDRTAAPQRPAAAERPAGPQRPAAAESRPEPARPATAPAAAPAAAAAAPAVAEKAAAEDVATAEKADAVEKAASAEKDAGTETGVAPETTGETAVADSEQASPAEKEKSLEEVAEAHLSDSYWTT